jgi:hypothetical protein
VQFIDHFRSHLLWLAVFRTAMHHAVTNRGQPITPVVFLDPVGQGAHRSCVMSRRHRPRKIVRLV